MPTSPPLLDPVGWRRVLTTAAGFCADGAVPGLALAVARGNRTTGVRAFGTLQVRDAARAAGAAAVAPIAEDTVFLVASLTKPIVAMGTLLLVERGLLSLRDRVADYIPDFDAADRRAMTVRHLLTHTSGLPDMLPNNRALRMARSPLSSFVSGACGVTLDFPPGSGVQYQSMGYALLGDVIRRVSGVSCAEFLRREIFEPLGMADTHLGLNLESADDRERLTAFTGRIAEVRVPPEQTGGKDWNWNSDYWRSLGVPWGGVLSTTGDLLTFCRVMLSGGSLAEKRIFSPATVAAATTNQIDCLHDVPEADRRTRAWGLGWRMNWLGHSASFSDLLGPHAFGHWGATGALFWIDPARNAAAVLLSTHPLDLGDSHLLRLSNMIAAAL